MTMNTCIGKNDNDCMGCIAKRDSLELLYVLLDSNPDLLAAANRDETRSLRLEFPAMLITRNLVDEVEWHFDARSEAVVVRPGSLPMSTGEPRVVFDTTLRHLRLEVPALFESLPSAPSGAAGDNGRSTPVDSRRATRSRRKAERRARRGRRR